MRATTLLLAAPGHRRPHGRAGLMVACLAVALIVAALGTLPSPAAAATAPTITGIAPRSGPIDGGQLLTIRGFHLTGTRSVLFGSVRSTDVRVTSETSLTVRTPAHGQGRVYVRVVRADATSPFSSVGTYFFLPRPRTLALGHTAAHTALDFPDVSCASASFCGAGGMYFVDSAGYPVGAVWNGHAWGAQHQLGELGFGIDRVSVSCAASPTRLCLFGTFDGIVWRTDGSTWTASDLGMQAALGHTAVPALSCATSRFCQAVAGNRVWTWDGTSWSDPQQVLGADGRPDGAFADVSCPTTAFCYAVVGGTPATAIRWQHGAWEPSRTIMANASFTGITCSSAAYCLASGAFGNGLSYLVYTGLAWSPPQPGIVRTETARPLLECLSPTSCVRSGTSYQTYNGVARALNHPEPYDGVSCWAAYSCLVVERATSSTTTRGTRP